MSDRSTHTDALATLGTIITSAEKRDAIHLAVYPVQAACDLDPGANVGLDSEGKATDMAQECETRLLGIVDPFLKVYVRAGDWFWLVVYPRQITSLRHVWEHPSFPDSQETVVVKPVTAPATDAQNKATSEAWLREWIGKADCPSYDTVIEKIESIIDNGNYSYDDDSIYFYGYDAHATIPPEFWVHYKNVYGRTPKILPEYFTCSC